MQDAKHQAIVDYLQGHPVNLSAVYNLQPTNRMTTKRKEQFAMNHLHNVASKHYIDNNQIRRKKDNYLIVPESKVNDVLNEIYHLVLGGRNKIFHELKAQQIAISKRRVEKWLKGSEQYQVSKHQPRKVIKPIISSHPFERLQADLAYIVRDTEDKITHYILVVIDHFTKYVWLYPTESKHVTVMAGFIADLIRSEKVIPTIIQTDNGTEFGHLTKHISEALGYRIKTKHITSTPYTPQSQGLVERTVQNVKRMLGRLIDDQYHPELVQQVQDALNRSYQDTIGMSPQEARKPENHEKVRQRIITKANKMLKDIPQLQRGDKVRVHLRAFDASLLKPTDKNVAGQQFSNEVYTVLYKRGNEYILAEYPTKWFRIDDLLLIN